MRTILTDTEVRVLGSLVEKQVTTPEYYPLSLNALTLACNQKNNRNPVTSFSEDEVSQALESLREKNLAYVFYGSTSRVPKYKHVMTEVLHLSSADVAVLCVLMLRGSQTIGEIRGNGARLHEFASLEEVEATVNSLITREPDRLVIRLPRQPGQKEVRFVHLLSGEPDVEAMASVETFSAGRRKGSESERVEKLEQDVTTLTTQVQQLQQQFEEFKKQFE
jgi:uncharacterized protein YceH (UPF0502 family)